MPGSDNGMFTVLMIGVPVLVVIATVTLVITMNRRPSGWVQAPGLVVDRVQSWSSLGFGDTTPVRDNQPVITFRTSEGRDITFRSRISGTVMPKPGDPVTVLYDPADPSRARIAPRSLPFTTRVLLPVALLAIAGVAVFILSRLLL
jgi:hypothetical protein